MKSYGGEIVTLELIDQLKTLDNQYAAEAGYYKFYFEEVKNGEVVDQIRMDLGDGVNSNHPIYLDKYLRRNKNKQSKMNLFQKYKMRLKRQKQNKRVIKNERQKRLSKKSNHFPNRRLMR